MLLPRSHEAHHPRQVSELKNELTKRASTPKALFEELGTNVSTKLSELKATVTNIKDGAPGSDKGLWRLDSDGMPLPEDGSPAVDPDIDSDLPTPVGLSQGTLLYRLRHLEAKVGPPAAQHATAGPPPPPAPRAPPAHRGVGRCRRRRRSWRSAARSWTSATA